MPKDRHRAGSASQAPPEQRKPSLKMIYLLTKNGDRTFWNRAGIGFVNRDGSINLRLDMFPEVSLQLRDQQEREGE